LKLIVQLRELNLKREQFVSIVIGISAFNAVNLLTGSIYNIK